MKDLWIGEKRIDGLYPLMHRPTWKGCASDGGLHITVFGPVKETLEIFGNKLEDVVANGSLQDIKELFKTAGELKIIV